MWLMGAHQQCCRRSDPEVALVQSEAALRLARDELAAVVEWTTESGAAIARRKLESRVRRVRWEEEEDEDEEEKELWW